MNIPEYYTSDHKSELNDLLKSPAWQAVLDSGLVEEVAKEKLVPYPMRNFIDTVYDQLLEFNLKKTIALQKSGCNDRDQLLSQLSTWPHELEGKDTRLSFVGINLTSDCNFKPSCIYCNQPAIPALTDLEDWKEVLSEITQDHESEGDFKKGPYIYFTGGEPLLLGEVIYGDNGLVNFATKRGATININTNGVLLTPEVCLKLIKAGTGRLHISLDSADEKIQNELFRGELYNSVLQGIYNMQLARDLVGVNHPVIHTNCVLTIKNMDHFPELFDFILTKTKQTADQSDPLFNDLFPHVIPVGGESNAALRPLTKDFIRFFEEIWPEASSSWEKFQDAYGVHGKDQTPLFGYFSNPFLRVRHKGGFDKYVEAAAEGRYGKLALSRKCYVAPTQASFSPDGMQYRCGSHAIRRYMPVGQTGKGVIFENIRKGIYGLKELPEEESCYGCSMATLYINQSVEHSLKIKISELMTADK